MQDNTLSRLSELRELDISVADIDISPNPSLPDSLDALRQNQLIQSKLLADQANELSNQIPGALQRLIEIPTQPGFEEPGSLAQSLASTTRFISQGFTGIGQSASKFISKIPQELGTGLGEAKEAGLELSILERQLAILNDDIYSSVWKSQVLDALPLWIQTDTIETVSDIIAITGADIGRIPGIETFLQDALDELEVFEAQRELERAKVIDILSDPTNDFMEFMGIYPSSRAEKSIVERIIEISTFELPEGLTPEDVRRTLVEIGASDDEANAIAINAARVAWQRANTLRQWTARSEAIKSEAEKIDAGELTSVVRKALWKRAATQPALALLRPVEFYSIQVTQPLAGTVLELGSRLRTATPDIIADDVPSSLTQALNVSPIIAALVSPVKLLSAGSSTGFEIWNSREEAEEYLNFIELAKTEGADSWQARRKAFEDWDANWAQKLMMEGAVDPLSYVGLGVTTKALKGIPLVGGSLASYNHGYAMAVDDVFKVMKQASVRLIPKTIKQHSVRYANETMQSFKRGFEETTNTTLFHAGTPEEVSNYAQFTVKQAMENPMALDIHSKVGRGLIGERIITKTDADVLVKNLNWQGDVDVELLESLNRVLETTEKFGFAKFHNLNEAIDHITLNVFGRADNVSRIQVNKFMQSTLKQIERKALAPFRAGQTVQAQMDLAIRGIAKNAETAARDIVSQRRMRMGIVGSMLDNIDIVAKNNILLSINRFFSDKMARGYLVFAWFVPANAGEVGIKSILSDVNPFFRGGVFVRNSLTFHGMDNVPFRVLNGEKLIQDLGIFEREFKTLSTASSRQGVSTNILRRFTARYTKAFSQARLLREVWNSVETVTGYNFGARLAGAQFGNYFGRRYRSLLTQTAPDTMEAIGTVVEKHTLGFERFMPNNVAKGWREIFENAAVSGNPELITNAPERFTIGDLVRGEAEKIFQNYTLLPMDEVDYIVAKAADNSLFQPGGIAEVRKIAMERNYEHYFTAPEVFEESYGDILEEILAQPIDNVAALNQKIELIDNTIEIFTESVGNSLDAARTYQRQLRNAEAGGEFLNNYWSGRLAPTISRVMASIEDNLLSQIDTLKLVDDSIIDPAIKDKYLALLGDYRTKADLWSTARLEYNAARASYFDPGGQFFTLKRDDVWWDEVREALDTPWKEAIDKIDTTSQSIFLAKANLSSSPLPTPADLSKREMNRNDVAQLFGTNPADLEASAYMTNIMAIQRRNDFISQTMTRANKGAKASGTTPEQLGWTNDRVGAIYDSIVRKYMDDPKIRSGIEPMSQQLNAALGELEVLGKRKGAMLTPEALDAVRKAATDIRQEMFVSSAGTIGTPRLVSQFNARVGTPRPMLPSGETRIVGEGIELRRVREQVVQEVLDANVAVNENITFIRNMKRRSVRSATNRLTNLKDNYGVNITTPETLLERFKSIEGNSRQANQLRTEYWDDFIKSLQIHLPVSLDATVARRLEAFTQTMTPGIPGVPDAPFTPFDDFADITIPADFSKVRGALQEAGISNADNLAEDLIRLERREFTRTAFAAELKISRNALVDLERLGFVKAVQGSRTRVVTGQFPFERPRVVTQPVKHIRPFDNDITMEHLTVPKIEGRLVGRANQPVEELQILQTPEWKQIKDAALEDTKEIAKLDFPDWDNQTAVSAFMRTIYPFWGYESHRLWWLPKEMTKHPGIWTNWGRYNNNTDGGYIDIPGTDIDINPLRGTILMGGFRRLAVRDYPEYYDTFDGLSETLDAISRWGFYPGAHIGLMQAAIGSKVGPNQFGEVLPPLARNLLLDIPTLIAPEATAVLRDIIFSDRFRNFLVANRVSQLELDKTSGIKGADIYMKIMQGRELSPEEQEVWIRAARDMAGYQLLMENTGFMRIRPEEKVAAQKAAGEIISAYTGLPIELYNDLRRAGVNPEEVLGPYSPELSDKLKQLEQLQRFAGANIALIPSQQGLLQTYVRDFWDSIATQIEDNQELFLVEEKKFEQGTITIDTLNNALADKLTLNQGLVERTKTGIYEDVPVTLDERKAYAEETGNQIFFHELEELRELLFQNKLEKVFDPELGIEVPDFDSYYLYQDLVFNSLRPEQARELRAFVRRNSSPFEILRRDINERYLEPYRLAREAVLLTFTPEQQVIINRSYLVVGDERKKLREFMIDATEDHPNVKLLSQFETDLRVVRDNLRVVDPEMDAWLLYFSRVVSAKSSIANERFNELMRITLTDGIGALINQ